MSNRERAKNKAKPAKFDDVQIKAGALEQDGKKVPPRASLALCADEPKTKPSAGCD